MSSWMTGVPCGGMRKSWVSWPPVWLPTKKHHVCPTENAVAAFARVVPRGADGQRVVGGEHCLGIERRGHRNRQFLCQRDQFAPRTGGGYAASGDNHRPAGTAQQLQRPGYRVGIGDRTERRNLGELPLNDEVGIQFAVGDHHAGDVNQIQVGGAGGAAHRTAESLAQVLRKRVGVMHTGMVLGNGSERFDVIHFLVGVALLVEMSLAASQRNHRRASQIGVLKPGGEVGRTDRL